MSSNLLSQEEINALLQSDQGDIRQDDSNSGEGLVNLNIILDFSLGLSVMLGETTRTLGEVRRLSPGTVIEMDRPVSEPVDILVNGKLIAQGEVVVLNENFGIKITHIINPIERVMRLK